MKKKPINVPALYQRDTLDKILFGWVTSALYFNYQVSVKEAVEQFVRRFGLDKYEVETGIRTYYRICDETQKGATL
jgi:hypothetical protein